MRHMKKQLPLFALFAFLSASLTFAQAPVTGSSDPESLFTSKDPKLNANKQVTLHIMRDLLEAGHWDDAPKYLTKEYIQHNPNVASGLDPVLKFFAGRPQKPIPAKNAWATKVVSVTAEGDLVTYLISSVPTAPGFHCGSATSMPRTRPTRFMAPAASLPRTATSGYRIRPSVSAVSITCSRCRTPTAAGAGRRTARRASRRRPWRWRC